MRCARIKGWLLVMSCATFALGACAEEGGGSDVDSGGDLTALLDGGGGGEGLGACTATPPPCQDESVLRLDLFDTINTGAVTEEGSGATFLTHVDAAAGGMNPNTSYVYLRFTPTGLSRVEISDEGAFASMDWDIAVRRYIVRLNSGVAGPSCVQGARTAPATTFEGLTSVPANASFKSEAYFTATCDYISDTSGIGAPGTVLASFWEYPGCVKMTHHVYVLKLASGKHIKLQVASYYPPANQEKCDTTGSIDFPSGAGNLRLRWAFLD